MIIKMVNEFKLTVVHVANPNPIQICACAWSYHWTKNFGYNNSGLGHGPWAVGRGPPGRWAAGLLLAKPGVPAELHLECSTKKLEYEHHEIVFGWTEALTWHFITVQFRTAQAVQCETKINTKIFSWANIFSWYMIYIYIYIYILHGKLRERAVCGEFCVLIGYPSGQDGAILPARDCPFRSRK